MKEKSLIYFHLYCKESTEELIKLQYKKDNHYFHFKPREMILK